MLTKEAEDFGFSLACQRDGDTDRWLFGRKAILTKLRQKFPKQAISEWNVRKIIQDARGFGKSATTAPTPLEREAMKKSSESIPSPKIIVKIPTRPVFKSKDILDTEHWVIGSDLHCPWEHGPSCEIFYKVIEYLQPTKVILLGDVVNLDAFSRYDKTPGLPEWVEDVASAGKILGIIKQASPKSDFEWRTGNHEARLKKHLIRHDPILYSKLSIPKLFGISDDETAISGLKGWKFIDETEEYLSDLGIVLKHGNKVRSHSGMSVSAEISDLLLSVIMGHAHRLGLYRKSSGRSRYTDEQPLFGMETGCLCRYDIPYRDGLTSNWQHGFGVLAIDRTAPGYPTIEPSVVEITDNRAVFRGKVFKA